jgi:APA family basic amino acid/polyamine antiporter
MLVILYGQTRIFFAMCRDGLMPQRLADVTRGSARPPADPHRVGLIAVLSAFVPLSSIVAGQHRTLFAFILVNIGVIRLRRTKPDMGGLRVPFSPVFPLIGVAFCVYLDPETCRA